MRQVGLIMRRELKETLRDPHVLVFLAFPLMLFPLMVWGALELAMLDQGWDEQRGHTLVVEGPEALQEVLLAPPVREGRGGLDALEAGEVDLVVVGEEQGPTWTVTLHHTRRLDSRRALRQTRERLDEVRQHRLEVLAQAHGLELARLEPPEIKSEPVGGTSDPAGQLADLLALVVAVLAPVAMWVSGLYPAVELAVSERERGTLETTLVAPVPRVAVLAGKLLALTGLLLAAVTANLIGVGLAGAQVVMVLPGVPLGLGLPPVWSLLGGLPVLVTSALFCGASYLLVMVPARTFQEAQSVGTLVLLGGVAPSLAAYMALLLGEPGLVYWALPMANGTLVMHGAITGNLTLIQAVVPALINGAVAALFVVAMGWIVGREDYLIGGRLPGWLTWIRRGEQT